MAESKGNTKDTGIGYWRSRCQKCNWGNWGKSPKPDTSPCRLCGIAPEAYKPIYCPCGAVIMVSGMDRAQCFACLLWVSTMG